MKDGGNVTDNVELRPIDERHGCTRVGESVIVFAARAFRLVVLQQTDVIDVNGTGQPINAIERYQFIHLLRPVPFT